jgi:2-methylcitrate dehydratase PrpD
VLELTGKKEPKTGLEAKFSVYHSAAVAVIRGYAGVKEYTDATARNPEVVALRQRVSVTTDPGIRSDEVFVTVTTTDGQVFEKHVEHAIGSVENPLTDSDLEFKFRQLAKGILPDQQVDSLLPMAWKLEEMADAGELPRRGALRMD